jgi:hypothetical protein
MRDLSPVLKEAHALLAAGDQHRRALQPFEQERACLEEGALILDLYFGSDGSFLKVRSKDGDAAVHAEMAYLGVHRHDHPALFCHPDDVPDQVFGDHALAVVRKDDGVQALSKTLLDERKEFLVRFPGDQFLGFPIEAHDLLVVRDDAGLDRGRSSLLDKNAARRDLLLLEQL